MSVTLPTLAIISLCIGLAYLYRLRRKDIFEPEPWWTMVLCCLIGGTLSILITTILYEAVDLIGLFEEKTAEKALLVVGPIEEFSKLAALIILPRFIKRHMNEPLDGIIYISCIALGFSVYENALYTLTSDDQFNTLVIRSLLCSPLHMMFTTTMGLAYYHQHTRESSRRAVLQALIMAALFHGMYDAILFEGFSFLLIILLILVLVHVNRWTYRHAVLTSPYATAPDTILRASTPHQNAESLPCPRCGNVMIKDRLLDSRFAFGQCPTCKTIAGDPRVLTYILQRCGLFYSWIWKMRTLTEFNGEPGTTLCGEGFINQEVNLGHFRTDALEEAIQHFRTDHASRIADRWWFPPLSFRKTIKDLD